jgi:hypothetical protein
MMWTVLSFAREPILDPPKWRLGIIASLQGKPTEPQEERPIVALSIPHHGKISGFLSFFSSPCYIYIFCLSCMFHADAYAKGDGHGALAPCIHVRK